MHSGIAVFYMPCWIAGILLNIYLHIQIKAAEDLYIVFLANVDLKNRSELETFGEFLGS